jgi:hypothetical protein
MHGKYVIMVAVRTTLRTQWAANPNGATRTVVGTNMCVRGPLEVQGKGIGVVADKEAYTVQFPSGSTS